MDDEFEYVDFDDAIIIELPDDERGAAVVLALAAVCREIEATHDAA